MNTGKTVVAALLVALVFAACPTDGDDGGSKPATVTIAAIPDVTAPASGATPVTAIAETAQYTRTVSWSPAVAGTFAASTAYTATITLTAKTGFTFDGVRKDFFTVAGATATNAAGSGVVTAVFPTTAGTAAQPAVVDIKAIPGVTAPVTGATQVTAIAGTAQYTGTVAWSPAVTGTFAASTAYTATITLTAKTGFTFTGITANFFTVAGATSTNAAGSDVVTAVFPATGGTEPVSVEMVYISGGTFQMGSPSSEQGRYSNELQHSVTVDSFRIGKYPVTQGQYQAVMGTNPSSFKTSFNAENPVKRPVETVSWFDAIIFCNKLSTREGLTPVYSINGSTNPDSWGEVPTDRSHTGYATWNTVQIVSGSTGYRLPTEAQWEYACRAGTTTPYNTGTAITDATGWYKPNSTDRSHEVGLKTPNVWGLYDMHGNVNEWCWDWYGTYTSGTQNNPAGPVSGTEKVTRGGYWYADGVYLRSACRSIYHYPSWRGNMYGFRVARP